MGSKSLCRRLGVGLGGERCQILLQACSAGGASRFCLVYRDQAALWRIKTILWLKKASSGRTKLLVR